jgi:hypothetical protein
MEKPDETVHGGDGEESLSAGHDELRLVAVQDAQVSGASSGDVELFPR